jgi:hypothetical protein
VKDRVILNINETIASIEMTYGRDVICEGVDLGKLSYQEQLKKAVESDIIIAMHGGAILQVVRFVLLQNQYVILSLTIILEFLYNSYKSTCYYFLNNYFLNNFE